jgi:carbonic anhydrase
MSLHLTREPEIFPDQALHRLRLSNRRFLHGTARRSQLGRQPLSDFAGRQDPYAAILCCSDSRVPPELIFDAGFGELFVIRVAGNVLSPEIWGSIQYADAYLHTPLLVVLGHEDCGAVKAAIEVKLFGAQPLSRVGVLVDDILPGLHNLDPLLPTKERLSAAVEANVRWAMHQILEVPEGQADAAPVRMKIAGAVYDIGSGEVRFLD